MGAEAVNGVVGAIEKSRQCAQDLVDAVRGARNERSVWYKLCKELGDSCHQITPLLDSVEDEVQSNPHTRSTSDAILGTTRGLSTALQDGTRLVHHCRTASRVSAAPHCCVCLGALVFATCR